MMKKAGFLLALICILSLTGCGMAAGAEEESLQTDTEENTMSINLDDVATQSESSEQYHEYLAQNTENVFIDEDRIESADATVSYDEGAEQYSIELTIETNGEVSGEQIELYKNILSKTYAEVVLVVDGSVM